MIPDDIYRAGGTEPWVANVVAALAAAVCHGKGPEEATIIETGTFMGTTTAALHGATNAFIVSVEADLQRWVAARKRLKELEDGNELLVVNADALEFLHHREPATADFIFLDDDHTAAHVAQEITLAKRSLRPGGMIVVHDVVGPFGLDAVVLAAGGFILDFPRLHAGGGLGILQPERIP